MVEVAEVLEITIKQLELFKKPQVVDEWIKIKIRFWKHLDDHIQVKIESKILEMLSKILTLGKTW